MEVQSYPVWLKTIASFRVGQVLDLKQAEDSDGLLLKLYIMALLSKRHYKGNLVAVHFYGSFA